MTGRAGADADLAAARIGVLFALPEESAPFKHEVDRLAARRKRTEPAALSNRCRIACSGAGAVKARRHAESLLAAGDLRCLVICGYAGGLTDSLASGDLFVADRVLDASGSCCRPHPDLVAAAMSVPHRDVCRGALFTECRVVEGPGEKRSLAARTGACAVDMETAGAADAANAHGIPWLAVRAISDGVNDWLPFDFNTLVGTDGEVDRGRVVRATLAHPWKIPAVVRLGVRSSRAARILARFLAELIPKISDRIDELPRPGQP